MENSVNVVGEVISSVGDIQIINNQGKVRDIGENEVVFANEQLLSQDSTASIDIGYIGLSQAVTYSGVFNILVDSSVYSLVDGSESILLDNNNFLFAVLNETIDYTNVDLIHKNLNQEDINYELGELGSINLEISDLISDSGELEILPTQTPSTQSGNIVSDLDKLNISDFEETTLITIDDVISVD